VASLHPRINSCGSSNRQGMYVMGETCCRALRLMVLDLDPPLIAVASVSCLLYYTLLSLNPGSALLTFHCTAKTLARQLTHIPTIWPKHLAICIPRGNHIVSINPFEHPQYCHFLSFS
jgi:hypothetical protein